MSEYTLDEFIEESTINTENYYISKSYKNIKYINSENILIGDIDVPKCVRTKKEAIALVEKAAQVYRLNIRVYETKNGIRYIVTNKLFPLNIEVCKKEALEILESTKADPLYVKLCCQYKRYAARLTPKHQIDLTGIKLIEKFSYSNYYDRVETLSLIKEHDKYLYKFDVLTFIKQCLIVFFDTLFSLR